MKIVLKTQETVVCPDIVGKELNEAKRLVESKGLTFHVVRYEKRNDIPYNHITVQKPAANITTKKGRTVLVIVSDGPELLPVPQLVGQEINRLDEILNEKKIIVEKIIYVPDENEGKIIAQTPKANETIQEGKGITIFVGKRPKRYVVMPDLKDMNISDIKEELIRKKIAFKINYLDLEGDQGKYNIIASVPKGGIFDADEGLELKISLRREDE
ncbi:MAG: PASTA domain-containing protein [Syntrophorhabdaceae bacterium]|nr:PASTA domain-containing protein [Syntrophorhabdaceae bacterium]